MAKNNKKSSTWRKKIEFNEDDDGDNDDCLIILEKSGDEDIIFLGNGNETTTNPKCTSGADSSSKKYNFRSSSSGVQTRSTRSRSKLEKDALNKPSKDAQNKSDKDVQNKPDEDVQNKPDKDAQNKPDEDAQKSPGKGTQNEPNKDSELEPKTNSQNEKPKTVDETSSLTVKKTSPLKPKDTNSPSKLNMNQLSISENKKSNLKYIIIDGSNVARSHGKTSTGDVFSSKGIKIAVEYFKKRGHTDIKAMIPEFRRSDFDKNVPTIDPEILDELEKEGYLTYTPSRNVDHKLIVPYDDRFILTAALNFKAVIVSNDRYRDLYEENHEWKNLIDKNLLQFTFVGDLFMVPHDPLGRYGPTLDQFLSNERDENSNYFQKSGDVYHQNRHKLKELSNEIRFHNNQRNMQNNNYNNHHFNKFGNNRVTKSSKKNHHNYHHNNNKVNSKMQTIFKNYVNDFQRNDSNNPVDKIPSLYNLISGIRT